MKTTQYVQQEKAIAAADSGGIRQRWLWATREHMRGSAHRAVDDPAQLARAARIVRAALARRKITLDELTPLSPPVLDDSTTTAAAGGL
jgi:hypothetical protein